MKSAVIVLGMHRSGTSAMARTLNLFGVKLPATLMEPVAEENELGFWESRSLSEFNEEILVSLGGSWDSPMPHALPEEQVVHFVDSLVRLLGEEFPGDDDQIMVKDPRISCLVPLWRAALAQCGYRARYIVMLRRPIEVAMSLNKRNGLPIGEGLALWLQYTLAAEKATRKEDRLMVSFDQLLTNWKAVVDAIEQRLALTFDHEASAPDCIESFIQPSLKRHNSSDYTSNGPAVLASLNGFYSELLDTREERSDSAIRSQLATEMKNTGALLLSVIDDYKKKNLAVHAAYDSLEGENSQLSEANSQLSEANSQLSEANLQMSGTVERLTHNGIELNALKRSISGTFALHTLNTLRYISRARVVRYFICKRLGKKSSKNIEREYRTIANSGLFDEDHYRSENPELSWMILDPLVHYILEGSMQLKNPSILFDEGFYRSQIEEDLTISGLYHYVSSGHNSNYNPHPFFDNSFYRQQLRGKDKNRIPLLHYFTGNNASVYSPHPNVNLEAYIDFNSGLRARGENPLVTLLKNRDMADIAERAVVPGLGAAMARARLTRPLAQEVAGLSFNEEKNPEISIVIPVFNEPEHTIRCLKSIQDISRHHYEIVVVDDCSTDESVRLLSNVKGLRYTRNQENQGYLLSCNIGGRLARGKYIVLLNNDTIVIDNWLDGLISVLETDPSVGVTGSQLIYPDGRLQEAGGIVFSDGEAINYGRGEHPQACQYCYRRDVDYVSAASLAIRAELWKKLNGYDEQYAPAYYEDTDLAFRSRAFGFRVVFCPGSRVIHVEGATCGTEFSVGVKSYQEVNRKKFFNRWASQLKNSNRKADRDKNVRARRGEKQMLWIDTLTPTPDHDSGSADTVNFIHAVLTHGWGVTFIPWENFRHAGNSTKRLQDMGVECIYSPYYDRDHCLQMLANQFDVIVVSRAENDHHLISTLRRLAPKAKIVFNTVDLHYLRMQRQLSLGGEAAVGLKVERVNEVRKKELENVNNSDLAIVISGAEEVELKRSAKYANTVVIPIQRNISGRRNGFDQRSDILFIGGFRHPPNVDAARYFVREIWPLVETILPGVKFFIGGSNMPDSVRSLKSVNVRILGYIDDMDKVFESIRVTVAPLRFGAGIKGKIVTSLGYGVPVVATSVAAEGMQLTDNKHAMIADRAKDFANKVERVYQDRSVWEELSENGLQLARDVYSIEVVSRKIGSTLESLTAR